jgi:hypothetical protein
MVKRWFWLLCLCIVLLSACDISHTLPATPTATSPPAYTLAGGGACVKLGRHPQPPYGNVQVSHDSYKAHSEPMLVENPLNPLNLVGGSKFFTDPAHYRFQIGYYTSFDGGCTWSDGGVLPGFAPNALVSDVSFAFDRHNDVYVAVLFLTNEKSGVAVSSSHDGGRTFGNPVIVFEASPNQVFSDKPWIVVDQTNGPRAGSIYVAWSYDHGGNCGEGNFCTQDLAFSRSTDGGKSFSPVSFIEGYAPFCTNRVPNRPANDTRCDAVIGAIPVLEPDGTLAVATMYVDLTNGSIPTRLFVVTSHDGGTTWANPVLIATIHDIDGIFPPERYRNLSLPAFACDPHTGQLYIAWSDKGSGYPDILFSSAPASGQSWSTPLRVNDDPLRNHELHFQPQMVVAPDGVISIVFFDTRLDPTHRLIDVYLAQSINHGLSFLKNARVTTQSWDPAVDAPVDDNGLQFIGDYQGLAADNQFVHPFWNDTRTGSQQIFTAAVPSALPANGH